MTEKYTPSKGDYITLQGKKYLPARRRVQWFRGEHPDWGIATSVVDLDFGAGYAVIRAEVTDETGRLIASGMKSETRSGFADFVEKAETGAIARAVAIAGFGTEDALDLDEGERIADSPVAARKSQPERSRSAAAAPQEQQLRNRALELAVVRFGKGVEGAMKQLADEVGVPIGGRATVEQLHQIIALIEQPARSGPAEGEAGARATASPTETSDVESVPDSSDSAPATPTASDPPPVTEPSAAPTMDSILKAAGPGAEELAPDRDEDPEGYRTWFEGKSSEERARLRAAGLSPSKRVAQHA